MKKILPSVALLRYYENGKQSFFIKKFYTMKENLQVILSKSLLQGGEKCTTLTTSLQILG